MRGRGPVVKLSRLNKALQIEAIIADYLKQPVERYKILDIGCGNGEISEFFSAKNEVFCVDIKDQRNNKNPKIEFTQITSENLPYQNNLFDIVLSHQVIEHTQNQNLHLQEIKRVLKADGICYLGTPNKSSPIMEGHITNNMVLRYHDMEPLFSHNEFYAALYTIKMLKEPKKYNCEFRFGKWIPEFILNLLVNFIPSHSFILRPQ